MSLSILAGAVAAQQFADMQRFIMIRVRKDQAHTAEWCGCLGVVLAEEEQREEKEYDEER